MGAEPLKGMSVVGVALMNPLANSAGLTFRPDTFIVKSSRTSGKRSTSFGSSMPLVPKAFRNALQSVAARAPDCNSITTLQATRSERRIRGEK
jgi:hypothetical protein